MAKKKLVRKKTAEARFLGTNYDLKVYLKQKKKALESYIKRYKDEKSAEEIKKAKGFVDVIDSVLELSYFNTRRTLTMAEIIEEVKERRASLKEDTKVAEEVLERTKAKAYELFRQAGKYMANVFEEAYNDELQVNLRTAIEEYQADEFELDNMQAEIKVYWWLLGIINRPLGFFEKVFEV